MRANSPVTGLLVGILSILYVPQLNAEEPLFSFLDSDDDGVLNPYEVLDTLLVARAELDGDLTEELLLAFVAGRRSDRLAQASEVFASLDLNEDEALSSQELGEAGIDLIDELDLDGNGVLNSAEAMALDDKDPLLLSTEEILDRVTEVFAELDKDGNALLNLQEELNAERRGRIAQWDGNRDGQVSEEEALSYIQADNTPVYFDVAGEVAYMTGVITSALPATLLQLLFEHPEVNTIEMKIVPGSIDDEANLRAASYLYQHGLTTRLTTNSSVASGGTDFFIGGKQRIIQPGAAIGVHSWSAGPGLDGSDVPRDDPQHQLYVDFYESVGVPGEFYWYTMDAASPANMHMMTEEEISRYKLRTGHKPQ